MIERCNITNASYSCELWKNLTPWLPGYDTFVLWNQSKTSSFRLPYQQHSSSANCTRELFKPSKDLASLIDCNEKKSFSFVFFVSDVISEVGLWPQKKTCCFRLALKSFCCGDQAESYTAWKVMGEIAFCQLTSISECDSTIQERLNFQEKWSWYYWVFPRRIFLSKVSAKCCTCVINTATALTWTRLGNAMRLILTNLQSALKKLADNHHRDVRVNWNELFFGN